MALSSTGSMWSSIRVVALGFVVVTVPDRRRSVGSGPPVAPCGLAACQWLCSWSDSAVVGPPNRLVRCRLNTMAAISMVTMIANET